MKKLLLVIACLLMIYQGATAQTATAPSLGNGSPGNPYLIETLDNLYWIYDNETHWDKHYIQTDHIDAASTSGWFDGNGWMPIGYYLSSNNFKYFTGNYDGQGYTISNLFINRTTRDHIGLFGYIHWATVKNLGVINADISGKFHVGAIVGTSAYSRVENCYTSGTVGATVNGGGLIGKNNFARVINCHSHAHIARMGTSSNQSFGGLIGTNTETTVEFSYSTGTITYENGTDPTNKGFIGSETNGTYNHNFFDSEASQHTSSIGALAKSTAEMKDTETFTHWDFANIWAVDNDINSGYPHLQMLKIPVIETGEISDYMMTSAVSGGNITSDNGHSVTSRGVVWSISPYPTIITNEGITTDGTGTGMYTSQLTGLTGNTLYFVRAWATNSEGTSYGDQIEFVTSYLEAIEPAGAGSEVNPYQIASLENLYWITRNLNVSGNKHYIQTENIDASSTIDWYGGLGWNPIGLHTTSAFSGSYDGQGHTIDGLFINRPDTDNVGLIGVTIHGGTIKNLHLTNIDITGKDRVGGIVGYHHSQIISISLIVNSSASGTVTGDRFVGGLTGSNFSSQIHNSYSAGTVSGNRYVGGLSGRTNSSASLTALINNCYSRSHVVRLSGSSTEIGAFVGENWKSTSWNHASNIFRSYSTGTVTYVGASNPNNKGFVGVNNGGFNNLNFYDREASQQTTATGSGATGKTTAEMKSRDTYPFSWNFETHWAITETVNEGYPHIVPRPTVVTPSISEITTTTASFTASITDVNHTTLTSRGVIWSSSPNPDMENNLGFTTDGDGAGEYESLIADLTPNTLYYVRAYASNVYGTGYSTEVSFVTDPIESIAPEGEGLAQNPYQIETLNNLFWIYKNQDHWNKHYEQIADIDALPTIGWYEGMGFPIIGYYISFSNYKYFTGTYNGLDHSISNLYINRTTTNRVGLFGAISGATLKNISLEDVSITARDYVGGLAGSTTSQSAITNCSSTGSITGRSYVGGLLGSVGSTTVTSSYSSGTVSGHGNTGGFTGFNSIESTIQNCYSLSSVARLEAIDDFLGSFAGTNRGNIASSYSVGIVSFENDLVVYDKGFVGFDNNGAYTNNFFDTEASLQTEGTGASPKTTEEMKIPETFTAWNFSIWDMDDTTNEGYPYISVYRPVVATWAPSNITATSALAGGNVSTDIDSPITSHGVIWSASQNPTLDNNQGIVTLAGELGTFQIPIEGLNSGTIYFIRAFATNANGTSYGLQRKFITTPEGDGTAENPYRISSLTNLLWFSNHENHWDKHYIQTADINASETMAWNDSLGWAPIGYHNSFNDYNYFTGSYNGLGHTIDSLFINNPELSNVGFFGRIENATVMNLGLTNVDISGNQHVGGIFGRIGNSEITHCFVSGSVAGNSHTGGMIGYLYNGDIQNSYSRAEITRKSGTSNSVAGFVGWGSGGSILHSYSTGSVSFANADDPTNRGFFGVSGFGGAPSFTNNYFDSETSLQSTGTGAAAKTTAEMKTQSTFEGWDFDESWFISLDENDGYPNLSAFGIPSLITMPVTNITEETAVSGGEVITEEGFVVEVRGIVWSTNQNPTIGNNEGITTDGAGLGQFESTITGINLGATYYVRAYATDNISTAYGNQVVFEALPAIPTYNLTLAANPAEGGTVALAADQEEGPYLEGTLVNVVAVEAEGYEFVEWKANDVSVSVNTTLTYTIPAEDVILTAHFSEIPDIPTFNLTLVASPAEGGTAELATNQPAGPYLEGETVNVVATPAEGYEFGDWKVNGVAVSNSPAFAYTMPAEDVVLTAHFSEIPDDPTFTLTLTASPAEGGTAALATNQPAGPYLEGAIVNVVATPATGYEFVEWKVNDVAVSNSPAFAYTMPAEDVILTAHFSEIPDDPTYTLTLTSSPSEGGTAALATNQPAGPYLEGATVNVMATPSEGYEFVEWQVNDVAISTSEAFGYTMPGNDVELHAVFKLIPTDVENHLTDNIKIYPNPFSDRIFFESTDNIEKITISNITGQQIMDIKNGIEPIINTSGFPVGIYLVRIEFKNGTSQTLKMIKK